MSLNIFFQLPHFPFFWEGGVHDVAAPRDPYEVEEESTEHEDEGQPSHLQAVQPVTIEEPRDRSDYQGGLEERQPVYEHEHRVGGQGLVVEGRLVHR
jgi:hypothetical protein